MTWFHQLLPIINPSTSFNYTLFFFIHIYIYIYFFFVFSSVNKLGIFIFSFHLCFFIFTVPKQLARLLERTQLVQHVASEKENSKCTRPSIWATCETHSLGDVTLPSLFIANHPPHFTVYSRFFHLVRHHSNPMKSRTRGIWANRASSQYCACSWRVSV